MRKKLLFNAFVCVLYLSARSLFAYTAPQNTWVLENQYMWDVSSSPMGVAVEDNRVYVTAGSQIHVSTLDGQPITTYGASGSEDGQFSNPQYLEVFDGEIYVSDYGNSRVQVISTNGVFLRKWDMSSAPQGIAVNNRYVYVGTSDQYVNVYTHDGEWQFSFGGYGTLPEQFSSMQDIAADDENVYVANYGNWNVKVFTYDGTFVREWDIAVSGLRNSTDKRYQNRGPFGIAVDDQCIAISIGSRVWSYGWYSRVQFFDKKSGDFLHEFNNYHAREQPSDDPLYGDPLSYPRGMAFNNPVVYIADNALKKITRARQIFRSLGTLSVMTNRIATGEVIDIEQRPDTPILDVDYVLSDDQPAVTAYALAFTEGVPSLDTLLPMNTLIEGTAVNVGSNMTVGVTNHLSWDVSADWNVDYGNVRVAVLAKDDRELLDLHYIHMPAAGANPPLTINRIPVTENDLLNLWFWVVASRDSRISFANGVIYGAGGTYDGQLFATNNTSTVEGRAFLFDYINVREATEEELQQAKEASTPGSITQWDARYKLPDGRPAKINEFGFDTGTTEGWWVVPLN